MASARNMNLHQKSSTFQFSPYTSIFIAEFKEYKEAINVTVNMINISCLQLILSLSISVILK